ncbi:alpha-L-arabinofuranosidase C-terminal domain-containing protein [Crateriforma conspicua]|uniref:non-reducing end alpha-L-arabinofuranosidase n=1 Tax=Crateriforma conspicua TaxID=2527996 RepID=A0A5C5Y516_9PLAN|nr:alpha-L-arabinofuranosidase C-terminal domain-containing protein [Crateriforma conspicua]TWT68502.1 Extracellular exo-alpha-L-arabinofuranosidase precursor [Crateriforma conspicua]
MFCLPQIRSFLHYGNRIVATLGILCCIAGIASAQTRIKVNVHADQPTVEISPHLYGLFFEDINDAADGGLYAELIQNRSFEYFSLKDTHPRTEFHPLYAWQIASSPKNHDGFVDATMQVHDESPLNSNNTHYVSVTADQPGTFGTQNLGLDGIRIDQSAKYDVSLYARVDDWQGAAPLTVRLLSPDGDVCGTLELPRPGSTWQKFDGVLTANETRDDARLQITTNGRGTLDLDMVSLFPQQTFNGRKNGLRKDLVEALRDLNPQFLRFPGGCITHGWGLDNRYRWKDSVGDVAQRKPNWNLWGYHQTYGLGYFEYFQLCEDLDMAPLPVVPIGVGCGFRCTEFVPMDELGPHVQDALDLIEFANGPADSTWGSVRAEMGHPEPFGLEFVCLGNEEHDTPDMRQRFPVFAEAIRKAYPEIKIIGTSGLGTGIPIYDLMTKEKVYSSDEHYYMSPRWFFDNVNRFDSFDRDKPLIFVGEYAAHDTDRKNTLYSALSEAAFLTGIERNADLVDMTCYAPLFGRKGHMQWRPDMIYFDDRNVVRTTNYYVQQLFSRHKGDVYLANSIDVVAKSPAPLFNGYVGIGTWNTTIELGEAAVNGRPLDLAHWKTTSGKFEHDNGHLAQTDMKATPALAISHESFSGEKIVFTARVKKTGGKEGFLLRFASDANGKGGYWWNVGGWNNRQHGIESFDGDQSSTIAKVDGGIESDQWYDLKIEMNGDTVRCFINGDLKQQVQLGSLDVSISSTYDRDAGEIILKLVNPTAAEVDAQIEFSGVQAMASSASVVTLAGTKDAVNTFESPETVKPVASKIAAGTEFQHTIPPYAVQAIRIKSGRTN